MIAWPPEEDGHAAGSLRHHRSWKTRHLLARLDKNGTDADLDDLRELAEGET